MGCCRALAKVLFALRLFACDEENDIGGSQVSFSSLK
jgi:hypothetical protein